MWPVPAALFLLWPSILLAVAIPPEDALSSIELERLVVLSTATPFNVSYGDGWELRLELNPFQMACMLQATNATWRKKRKKMEVHTVCNEDGSECEDELVEVDDDDGQQAEDDDKTALLKDMCENVGESYQKETSGLFMVCYESWLDPANNRSIKPQFRLSNIDLNLSAVCQEKATTSQKVWHGFAMKFWVTRKNTNLLIHMQIHFSYTDKITIVPIIRQSLESNDTFVKYAFNFNIKTTFIMDDMGKRYYYPANKGPPLLANGRYGFQNKAGLWLAHLDMFASSYPLILSEDQCHKWNAFLNGNAIKTEKCKQNDESRLKDDEKRKKQREIVNAIMEQVYELEKKCHYIDDPEMQIPKSPSELQGQNSTHNEYDDILYTPEQANEILKKTREKCGNVKNPRNGSVRKGRQIDESMFSDYTDVDKFHWSKKLWDPKEFPIPYTFQHFNNKAWIVEVTAGVKLIMDETCITFKYDPSLSESGTSISFINFVDKDGCFSNFGRQRGINNIKVRASSCPKASVAHEIMHTLGFQHEHKRNDRDAYIWKRDEAIYAYHYAFDKKKGAKNLGTPYDFASIMHYAAKDFGKTNAEGVTEYTIIAKERAYQQTMGQRNGLSFKDSKLLNRIYCEHVCTVKLLCANGGYTDPKDCSKCRCPHGFRGKRCDRFYRGEAKCHSGRYYADITAKNIETTDVMNGARICLWSIKTLQIVQAIVIRIIKLQNFKCKEPCGEDNYLEVHMRNDRTSRGARLCCASTLPFIFTLERGVDALISLKRSSDDQQFQLSYETQDAIEPEKPLKTSLVCACDRVFNPWHKPGEAIYDPKSTMYYSIGIKSRSNLIINGKYRFYTQNGTKWFDRDCVTNDASVRAFGVWIEPKTGASIKLDHIVAEECATDYERSGCAELNRIWKEFVACLLEGEKKGQSAKETSKICTKGEENFRLSTCGIGGDGSGPKFEPGVQ